MRVGDVVMCPFGYRIWRSSLSTRIQRIVIVGGGTAGWMTAAYLGRAFGRAMTVTLIEAPSIPRIGVGEATVPNLQKVFFDFLGLAEEEWMRECNASYKMGIKFINWRSGGESAAEPRSCADGPDRYFHLFGLLPNHEGLPLSHYWNYKKKNGVAGEPFDYTCYREPPVLDHKLAPRHSDGTRWTNYAWHFDARLVADFLCRFSVEKQGVVHVQDEVADVDRDERGFITALRTSGGRTLEGDLFVDCSGFQGLLINRVMRESFLDMSDYLLNDRAVATQIPHDDDANGVEPFTSSIAMSSGWSWKIPMLGRFGTGYVYSSQFITQEDATIELCRMWGLDPENTQFNNVRFRVGRNRRTWVKNCVSVGLSSSFLEPLESTGLYFVYATLYQLVKHFPDSRFDPVLIDNFNREIDTMFDDSRDFIQAHFYFSPRTDTAYWRANKDVTVSEDLRDKIRQYRSGLPVNMPTTDESQYYDNFDAEFRNFWNNSNYYCIFAGLGEVPDHVYPPLMYRADRVESAEQVFDRIRKTQRELLGSLPSHYEALRLLHSK